MVHMEYFETFVHVIEFNFDAIVRPKTIDYKL